MQLAVLDDDQIRKLHVASLHVLEAVGVQVPHADVRKRFREAGATVDDDTQRVRIPEAVVEDALAQAGKSFTIYGRDREKRAVFGEGRRNYNSISGEALWIDDETGERRYAALPDAATAGRLADALPDLTIAGAMCDPHELSPEYGGLAVAAELIRNTTKPIGLWFHNRTVSRFIVELLIAVAGSEEEARRYPLTYPFLEPISPLRFPFDGVDALYATARLNLPVPIGPMAQTGMSAPGTLAGTLVQITAEQLSGIVYVNLLNPGHPLIMGCVPAQARQPTKKQASTLATLILRNVVTFFIRNPLSGCSCITFRAAEVCQGSSLSTYPDRTSPHPCERGPKDRSRVPFGTFPRIFPL